jgi:hypothetical protein
MHIGLFILSRNYRRQLIPSYLYVLFTFELPGLLFTITEQSELETHYIDYIRDMYIYIYVYIIKQNNKHGKVYFLT